MNASQFALRARDLLTAVLLANLLGNAGTVFAQSAGGATLTQFYRDASLQAGACTDGGAGVGSVSGTCALPGVYGGEVTTIAKFTAPATYNPANPSAYQFASLGTAATSTINVYSLVGPTPAPANSLPGVRTAASASYRDYLELGAIRPTSLALSFELSGTLDIKRPSAGATGYEAGISYSVTAQSGALSSSQSGGPLDVFGSFANFGYGGVNSRWFAASGAPPDVTVNSNLPGNAFAFTSSVIAPDKTLVTVTLGAPFFSNSANGWILLDLSLLSEAHTPAVAFELLPFGETRVASATSTFDSTFKMVGMTAYDDLGNDITGDAIAGFVSMQPVPEPGVAMMLLAGLCTFGFVARRRTSLAARGEAAR